MYCMIHTRTLSVIINLDIFSYIQPYCGVFRILCSPCMFKTLPYSESWHIWNPRYTQNSVKPYSGIFRHIQAYSGIFNDDSYNNINFLFFTLISHTLQRNLKRQCFLAKMTPISTSIIRDLSVIIE